MFYNKDFYIDSSKVEWYFMKKMIPIKVSLKDTFINKLVTYNTKW